MANIEHSLEKEADEVKVRIEAGMRIAKLQGGGRRITHPSGHVSIETPQQRAQQRAEIVQDIADGEQALAAFDKEEE